MSTPSFRQVATGYNGTAYLILAEIGGEKAILLVDGVRTSDHESPLAARRAACRMNHESYREFRYMPGPEVAPPPMDWHTTWPG